MSPVKEFRRYELKYLLNEDQMEAMQIALESNMETDRYGRSSIRNIYFDTDDYLLARRSNEKPFYKEKLRFRSYGRPAPTDEVFVELKKKYDGVVYKRRLMMPLDKAMDWFTADGADRPDTQIADEIDFLRIRYPGIGPKMLLTYDRDAYSQQGTDLRITIDRNVLARIEDVDLTSDKGGRNVLPDGYSMMEIKTLYGYPQWLTRVLSDNGLYKTSFSKYGNAYKEIVLGFDPKDLINVSRAPYGAGNRTADGIRPYEARETVYSQLKTAAAY